MNPIEEIVAKHGVMILDGAFSTELEHRGCDLDDPLWSAKILMENSDASSSSNCDRGRRLIEQYLRAVL